MNASAPVAPKAEIAAIVRARLEAHTEWDALHEFISLHWDGTKVMPGTVACFTHDVNPEMYPAFVKKLTRQIVKDQGDTPDLVAFMFFFEGYTVDPRKLTSEKAASGLVADALARRLHTRPDRIEMAAALAVDVHGRYWQSTKQRPTSHRIVDEYQDHAITGTKAPAGFTHMIYDAAVTAKGVLYAGGGR